jgi:hypothetical protein
MNLKAQVDTNTLMVGDLSPIESLSRQKINKNPSELIDTLDQTDIMDIYRLLSNDYTIQFILAAHGTFSKIDNIL